MGESKNAGAENYLYPDPLLLFIMFFLVSFAYVLILFNTYIFLFQCFYHLFNHWILIIAVLYQLGLFCSNLFSQLLLIPIIVRLIKAQFHNISHDLPTCNEKSIHIPNFFFFFFINYPSRYLTKSSLETISMMLDSYF